jgi:ATP-binding cassette, subfamily B, bacterial MsbA
MRAFLKLRRYARDVRGPLALAAVSMAAAAWLNMQALSKMIPVFDKLFKSLNVAITEAERSASMDELKHRAMTLLMVIIGAAIANATALYLGDLIGQRVLVRLRASVYDHLQSLSMSFFDRSRSGELISRINNDTVVLQRALGSDFFKAIVSPLTVILIVGKMLSISWSLSLALGVTIPVVFVITSVLATYTRRYARRTQVKVADLTAISQENLAAMAVIKTFGLEPQTAEHFREGAMGVFSAEMKAAMVKAIAYPPVFGLVGVATSATLVFGGYQIMHGTMTAGGLMGFLFMLEAAAAQVNSVSRVYLSLQSAEAAAERTLEILGEVPDVIDAPDAIELEAIEGGITFDNVSFSYDGEHDVLHDFSLNIKPGEVVALAGPSGSGKTTVANLVPRLYDVQQGRVLVDGLDVRAISQASLKRFMGSVPQETILFTTTIRQNIAMGREGATEEDIIAAAKAANAHDFILELPNGYETQCGERGVLLSGGQRQRVAIARAFLRDPRILILDEATSSLDTESEKAVHAALDTLLKGRTALIIAHRLSTIQNADRIVVMAHGRIAEQGTHEELLAGNGLYRRLYESTELTVDANGHSHDAPAMDMTGSEA